MFFRQAGTGSRGSAFVWVGYHHAPTSVGHLNVGIGYDEEGWRKLLERKERLVRQILENDEADKPKLEEMSSSKDRENTEKEKMKQKRPEGRQPFLQVS